MKFINKKPTVPNYKLDNPFSISRWMCPDCGLIFDSNVLEYGDPGSIKLYPDPESQETSEAEFYGEKFVYQEHCPRCELNFEQVPRFPVSITNRELSQLSKLTFFVEDSAHKNVLENIAQVLRKDIGVKIEGRCENVKMLQNIYQSREMLQNAYFLIDCDNNKMKQRKAHLIQLDKYWIISLCSVVSTLVGW